MAASMNTTFGMLFDAVVIGAALYGGLILSCRGAHKLISITQRVASKDTCIIGNINRVTLGILSRWQVGFILICDTLQVGILTACGKDSFIIHMSSCTLIIEIFFSDAIALAVQMFYCWRIWRLSQGSYLVVIPLVLLSWAAFVSLLEFIDVLQHPGCVAASDVMISSAMVLFLQKAKNYLHFQHGAASQLLRTLGMHFYQCLAYDVRLHVLFLAT
ncbi:hypothetical protein F5050DRAFT_1710780 [Lentinula boryana]|uniref:Uncharacterized protein n=1 Tax=Lentinula boryana TaxID=40481 RepID=A0ABQ8QHX8_9AGAR|nr:hypothetical protein F5050DRAFT_1710780 [Lentinula boryana]